MSTFTSPRERRLWAWALAVLLAIYATLGLGGSLVQRVSESGLLGAGFMAAFILFLVVVAGLGLSERPGRRETWVAIGVAAVYAMVFIRMGIPERTHLFEYGLLAVLLYHALDERRRGGRRVPAPAALAVLATALLGWLDEGIQSVLAHRVYDIVDVGFNALAGLMSVSASVALGWARRSIDARARS